MHACVAILTKEEPTESTIEELMNPFDESLEIEYNKEDDYYYNPDGMWDWYNICRWNPEKMVSDYSRYGSVEPYTELAVKVSDLLDDAKTIIEGNPTAEEYPEEYETWQKLLAEGGEYHKSEYYLKKFPAFLDYMLYEKSLGFISVITPDGKWDEYRGGFGGMGKKEIMDFIETFLIPNRDCWISVVNYHF